MNNQFTTLVSLLFSIILLSSGCYKEDTPEPIPESSKPRQEIPSNTFTFIDQRDGQAYEAVEFSNGIITMAQNLNFEIEDSWCYDDDPENCEKFGRLYTWSAAMEACPPGWRLPKFSDGTLGRSWFKSFQNYNVQLGGYRHQRSTNDCRLRAN